MNNIRNLLNNSKINYQNEFIKNGYIFIKNYFSEEQSKLFTKCIDDIYQLPEVKNKWMIYFEKKNNKKYKSRIENIYKYNNGIKDIVDNDITPFVSYINMNYMNLFKDKINWKLSNTSGFKPHQDYLAFADFGPTFFITVALFGNNNTVENGCLEIAKNYYQYLENYNKNIKPNKEELVDNDERKRILNSDPENYGNLCKVVEDNLEWIKLETTPRDLLLFDSFIPHRSGYNKSDKSRINYYLTYNNKECGYLYDEYFKEKRKEFPPDFEMDANTTRDIKNSKFNIANPINS